MRQVLFYIPTESIAKFLPDLPLLVYIAAAAAVYGVFVFWERRRAAKQADGFNVQPLGMLLAAVLVLAAIIKYIAPPAGVPIYGYGSMLFVAFVACTGLAAWLAKRQGMPINTTDLALWIFVFGIIGGRVTFMIQYRTPPLDFFKIWEGGLVFYGAAFGGVVGYFVAYFAFLKKQGASTWKMIDIIAPCGALGLALGRIGCLLNGCCYGDVACPGCPAIHFPASSPPAAHLRLDYQMPAGFTLLDDRKVIVEKVDPDSDAANVAAVKPGDIIVKVNGEEIDSHDVLTAKMRKSQSVALTVQREGNLITLPEYSPRTIGVHPTQIYETISMVLLLALLLAFLPIRRREGAVMVLFMFGYAGHRFLNEILREDTLPVAGTGMTLSQNISILVAVSAVLLMLVVLARPARPAATSVA